MRNILFIIAAIAFAILICSCCRKHLAMKQSEILAQSSLNEISLFNQTWMLIEIRMQPIITDTAKTPYIILNQEMNSVSGNGGCNSFSGTYTLEGKLLGFSDFISTKMACDILDIEYKFLSALKKCYSYQLKHDTLILSDDQDQRIALFKAKSR